MLAKLEGVSDVNAAMVLKGKTVFIDRTGVELPDGRHFIADLIGLDVLDADSGRSWGWWLTCSPLPPMRSTWSRGSTSI